MRTLPDYAELKRREPRLRELEERVHALHDDGKGSFFCANFLWLPLASELRQVVGVMRISDPELGPGDAQAEALLGTSDAFESAYIELTSHLPTCRDCGCRLYQPILEQQLG